MIAAVQGYQERNKFKLIEGRCTKINNQLMDRCENVAKGCFSLAKSAYASTAKLAQHIKVGVQSSLVPFFKKVFDPSAPNFSFQNKIDALGAKIEKKFAGLTKFNAWLDSNGQGAWYKQLAIFLAKLPLRSIRNILKLLYNTIKGVINFCIHPITSVHEFINNLRTLCRELLKPETWSKIGIGMIGGGLGQAALGSPISVISMGIGAAFLAAGLTVGSIQAARAVDRGLRTNAVGQYLLGQAKQLPELLMTGFSMGLIMGCIQRSVQKNYENRMREDYANKLRQHDENLRTYSISPDEARSILSRFVAENNLPIPRYQFLQPQIPGHYSLAWSPNASQFIQTDLGRILAQQSGIGDPLYVFLRLHPTDSVFTIWRRFSYFGQLQRYIEIPVSRLGINFFPAPAQEAFKEMTNACIASTSSVVAVAATIATSK